MSPTTERYLRKFLWFLTVLISFLLLFEKYLALPAWVQVIGRLHPVVLHFPIVLLIGSITIEFSRESFTPPIHLKRFLWLITALSSALAVLMGLFLSQEEGYLGSTVFWHKWTGVGVFYASVFVFYLYSYLTQLRFKNLILIALGVLLLLSGHLGAELTHGEGFITQPLQKSSTTGTDITFEEALVFDHMIRPILETKCANCHNERKSKGDLVLIDSLHMLKGGKSGLLFEPFDPTQSLLIDRIHLPIDDKKHMPPKGKPQLTPLEIRILHAWIQSGAPFRARVSDFTAQDSLSVLGQELFSSASRSSQPMYSFKPAPEETIRQLTNEYRSIQPLAFHSPALSVELYGPQAYSSQSIEALKPLKTQIVELNLSRMPVQDQDLQLVTDFVNLNKLNLNFTGITGEGLSTLTALKNLQSLLLAGTTIDGTALRQLLAATPSLRHVSLWDTKVDYDQISDLRKQYPQVALIGDFIPNDTTRLKLNFPIAKSKDWVFDQESAVELSHSVRDTQLHYTLDGSEPDSLSPRADGPIRLERTTEIKVRAYKKGWFPSDVAVFPVYQNTYKPDSVFLFSRLNHVHLAEGAHTFFDKQLGKLGANNPAWANHFAGVRHNDLQLMCWFDQPIDLNTVGLRIMIEEETGIYPPGSIEVWGGKSEDQLGLIAKQVTPRLPEPGEKASLTLIEVPVRNQRALHCLKIVAKPFQRPGERPKLLLIDEMFLN